MRADPQRAARAFALLLGLAATVGAAHAEGLYYQIEGGALVITNSPAAGAARPLPGWGSDREGGVAVVETPSRWDPYFELAAREAGLSAQLVKAVARVESGFDPRAVSPKGAQGMMQLMPATAQDYGVADPFDAWQNVRAGARHLRSLLDRFGDLDLALAAYNAGPAAVERHGGIPAYAETIAYVRKVRLGLGVAPRSVAAPSRSARESSEPVRLTRGADGSVLLAN